MVGICSCFGPPKVQRIAEEEGGGSKKTKAPRDEERNAPRSGTNDTAAQGRGVLDANELPDKASPTGPLTGSTKKPLAARDESGKRSLAPEEDAQREAGSRRSSSSRRASSSSRSAALFLLIVTMAAAVYFLYTSQLPAVLAFRLRLQSFYVRAAAAVQPTFDAIRFHCALYLEKATATVEVLYTAVLAYTAAAASAVYASTAVYVEVVVRAAARLQAAASALTAEAGRRLARHF